jgi:hypothetical protein
LTADHRPPTVEKESKGGRRKGKNIHSFPVPRLLIPRSTAAHSLIQSFKIKSSNMKRIFIYATALAMLAGASSCDSGFEEVNKNPVLATSVDPVYLFSNAQFGSAIATQNYQMQIVQQINTPYTGVLEGGNHNAVSDPNSNANFNSLYLQNGPVNLLTTVIADTKDDPARSNLYNMSRIWKA